VKRTVLGGGREWVAEDRRFYIIRFDDDRRYPRRRSERTVPVEEGGRRRAGPRRAFAGRGHAPARDRVAARNGGHAGRAAGQRADRHRARTVQSAVATECGRRVYGRVWPRARGRRSGT